MSFWNLLDEMGKPKSVFETVANQVFRIRCDVERRGRVISDDDLLAEVRKIFVSFEMPFLDTELRRAKTLEFFHARTPMPTAERMAEIRAMHGIA